MSIDLTKINRALVFLCLSLFVFGCSNEDTPYYEITKVELKGASCFANITDQLDKFFAGNSSEREVNQIWDCASRSIQSFSSYVEGDKANSYRAKDLRTFLEKYFLNDKKSRKAGKVHKISDGLLDEAMQVKRLFIGGSKDRLTKEEVRLTISLIEEFRKITLELLPHTRILFGDRDDIYPSYQYQDAENALKKAFVSLSKIIARSERNYEFSSLTKLMEELGTYFKVDNPDTPLAEIAKYVPMIAEVRGLMLNGSREAVQSDEWVKTGELAGQLSGLYLRFRIYLSEKSLLDEDQYIAFYGLISGGLDALKSALALRQNGSIPNSEVDVILGELGKLELLPFDMDTDGAVQLWKRIVDFVLNPQNKFPATGFSNEKLNYIENMATSWRKVQLALIRQDRLNDDPDYEDMKQVMATPWPMRLDPDGRIIIDGDRNAVMDLESSTRLNWSRVLFQALFNAYIEDKERREVKRQLSRAELKVAYTDLKPLLIGLGLIEKTDNDFDQRLFRDANLFMPRSDGDKYLGFYEVVEYLHFVFAGIDAGDIFLNGVQGSCRPDEDHMDIQCFRRLFQKESNSLLAHLPLYLKYSNSLSDDKWRRDIRAIEISSRDEGASPTPMATADIYETFIMLQYIETLFLRFDKDNTGDLDLKEVFKALELFRNILKDIFGLNSQENDQDLENFFTYMMKYGDLPNPDDPVSDLRYQNWVMSKPEWRLAATRGTVLQILAAISSRF